MLLILGLQAAILLGIVLLMLRKNPIGPISASLQMLGGADGRDERPVGACGNRYAAVQGIRADLTSGMGQSRDDASRFFEQVRKESTDLRELRHPTPCSAAGEHQHRAHGDRTNAVDRPGNAVRRHVDDEGDRRDHAEPAGPRSPREHESVNGRGQEPPDGSRRAGERALGSERAPPGDAAANRRRAPRNTAAKQHVEARRDARHGG